MALAEQERRIANYIEFIGDRKGTKALGSALSAAEQRAEGLRSEVDLLAATTTLIFQPPPVEWIALKLERLQEVLERETARSALLVRGVLGPAKLIPTTPAVGRPYYQA